MVKNRLMYFSTLGTTTLVLVGGIAYAAASVKASAPTEKVMTIGGSVAHGWKDVKSEGYLHRALQELETATFVPYAFYDRTIVGANGHQLATMYKGDYTKWLNSIHPTVVIISWGLLNDALPKVPYHEFAMYLKQEILEALTYHAVVLVVSPPVTKATYTQYPVQVEKYDTKEHLVVKALNNKNVYFIDLMNQMKGYLKAHHQTYKPYSHDGWHPNEKGHILAGQILEKNLLRLFGKQPIAFKN